LAVICEVLPNLWQPIVIALLGKSMGINAFFLVDEKALFPVYAGILLPSESSN